MDDYSVKGDRALDVVDDDKLGFRDVAKRIGSALTDGKFSDGLGCVDEVPNP